MVGHGKLRVRSAITRTVGFFGILALLAAALSTTADVPFKKIKRSRNSLHSFETIQNSRTSRKSASHVTSRNRKLTPTAEFFDIAIIPLVDYFRSEVRLASARLPQK